MHRDTALNFGFLSPAVEGMEAAGVHGRAPAAGADEPGPDWQPL
jgi:hypothetical protein